MRPTELYNHETVPVMVLRVKEPGRIGDVQITRLLRFELGVVLKENSHKLTVKVTRGSSYDRHERNRGRGTVSNHHTCHVYSQK